MTHSSEAGMKRDGAMVAQAIHDRNPSGIVAGAGNIARRADRVIQVANQEADNSEDPQFVHNVKAATEKVKMSEYTLGGVFGVDEVLWEIVDGVGGEHVIQQNMQAATENVKTSQYTGGWTEF